MRSLALVVALFSAIPATAEVRFLATADCQYENGNQARKESADNGFKGMFAQFESDPSLRGMLIAGDLTQNARRDEFKWYQSATANHADDIFEGLGNHDMTNPTAGQTLACGIGLGSCVYPKTIAEKIFEKNRNTSLIAAKKPHYAWRWDDIVFIQLNVFPGSQPAPQFPDISPMDSLNFLKDTLRQVGPGQSVVVVHHYGFDPFSRGQSGEEWWTEQQRKDYWQILSNYRVEAIITGHVHLETRDRGWNIPWRRPAGITTGPDMIPTFVAGAGLHGAYIEVSINAGQVQVKRHDANGSIVDQTTVNR